MNKSFAFPPTVESTLEAQHKTPTYPDLGTTLAILAILFRLKAEQVPEFPRPEQLGRDTIGGNSFSP